MNKIRQFKTGETRECRKCMITKSINDFNVDNRLKTQRKSVCKKCLNPRSAAFMVGWRKRNPDHNRQYHQLHKKEIQLRKQKTRPDYYYNRGGQEKSRISYLKQYGLTPQIFADFVEKQEGKCAICHRVPFKGGNQSKKHFLCIDHCHKTSIVRGLLCSECNLGLSKFEDNIVYLNSAIKYLQRYEKI